MTGSPSIWESSDCRVKSHAGAQLSRNCHTNLIRSCYREIMVKGTTSTTHVGKLLTRYKGHFDKLPDSVHHLPVYIDYAVKRNAINAGLPQPLYPNEFLRYLLIDKPVHESAGDAKKAKEILPELEKKLGYEPRSIQSNIINKHTPKERIKALPEPLQVRLAALSGKQDFWGKTIFDSSEAADIVFDMNIDVTELIARTSTKGGFVSLADRKQPQQAAR
jgi:hypothetical protein